MGVRKAIRSGVAWALWATGGALLVGCGDLEIRPDSSSGKDGDRSGADQLFLDKLMDDYLSAEEGDNTDWKYFKVTDRGFLKLTVFWDDHKTIDSVIDVRDRFGALIGSRKHSAELEKDEIELRVEAGTHFVRLYTEKGSSVYTIEGLFQPFDYNPPEDETQRPVDANQVLMGGDDLPPLAVEDGRPQPADGRPVRRPGGGRRPGGNSPPPGEVKPEKGGSEAAVAGNLLSATISRIIDGRGKKGSYVWINKGSEDGVQVGADGFIVDDDGSAYAKIKVEKVNDRGAQAFCTASPTEIAHRRRVKVQGK